MKKITSSPSDPLEIAGKVKYIVTLSSTLPLQERKGLGKVHRHLSGKGFWWSVTVKIEPRTGPFR